jgi:hypothetical protein
MPVLLSSLNLESFLEKEFPKSFWNGKGTFDILSEPIVAALERNPDVTLGALRQQLRDANKPLLLESGLTFNVDPIDPIRLGAKNGSGGTGSVSFSVHGDASARLFVVFRSDAFSVLQNEHPADLGTMLRDHTILSGQDALVVLAAGGQAGADLAATVLNAGGFSVGVSFSAGAGVDWMVCRAAHDSDSLLGAVRATFAAARLPQSTPDGPGALLLAPNEILYSSYVGFMKVGATAAFGYKASGTANYKLGKLDLATTLLIKADAEVSISFGLTGAFKITVLPGAKPGWVRVVVEKHRTSTFEFGVGVTVDAELKTKGLPDTSKSSLALLESILGFKTPQLARQALDLAQSSPDELRRRADGAIKALVESYTGKAFDALNTGEIATALAAITTAAKRITEAEDRLIALYEQYVVANLEPAFKLLEDVFKEASLEAQRDRLLQTIADPLVRQLIALLVDRTMGQVITAYTETLGELKAEVEKLHQFIAADTEHAIRNFIEARIKAFGLEPLFAELKQIDSIDKLKARSTSAVDALVERLTGRALDELFARPDVKALIGEVNSVAKRIEGLLKQFNDIVTRALNAKGRFELSYAYQRVREGDKLMDVQINVDPGNAALAAKARDVYANATRGRFDEVLKDENASVLNVTSTAFTDVLKRVGTLDVNVFGWNYKEVNTVLLSLNATVQESPTGLITIYSIDAKGQSVQKSAKRTLELNYLFQVTGQVKGAFQVDGALQRQAVDAFDALSRMKTSLSYAITDPLTSLDELRSYFGVGAQLHVLGPGQIARLIGSIEELRRPANGAPAALDGGGFRKVGVTYTVGFKGEALARALKTDLTGTEINWWEEMESGRPPRPVTVKAKNHRQALLSMYIDRLIASYLVGRSPDPSTFALPALFANGVVLDMLENSARQQTEPWHALGVTTADDKVVRLNVPNTAFGWASRHTIVGRDLAEFLDEFRKNLTASDRQPISGLERFLERLVAELVDVGKGDEASFPFMLLDELVRRTNPSTPDARDALLEVTLFDDKNKPIHYIPVHA